MSDKLSNKHQGSSSAMQGSNTLYLETLYRRYQKDNNAVHSSWKSFFDNLESSPGLAEDCNIGPSWVRTDWPPDESNKSDNFFNDGQAQKVSEKLSALTSNSDSSVSEDTLKRAVLDSIRALI